MIEGLVSILSRLEPEDELAKAKLTQKIFDESTKIKNIEKHNTIMGSLREPIRYFHQMGEMVRQFILSY
jgi:hypothetical protein